MAVIIADADDVTEPSGKTIARRRRGERARDYLGGVLTALIVAGAVWSIALYKHAYETAPVLWHAVDQCYLVCAEPGFRPVARLSDLRPAR